ncbi:malonate transporter, MadL subunit [Collimonas sp. OK307]|uniref:malonate transporter subunit MadL n=1 Tax=Collimonas sp. OK307 TaxID=1801620 RepID=UPI0008DF3046|nr:malonate transporter subunit MadL [Collimonas sp. OK307]SFH65206.1 malonate transporter, MadL subunit [Collimonas sp. OK307]
MIIYGVAVLAICTLIGQFAGSLLGVLLGVQANVGGVGFAMILLLVATDYLQRAKKMPAISAQGITFWTAMYIPVVVAMAAQQNVVAALKGGPAAILAGVLAVAVSFALIPVIDRIGKAKYVVADAAEQPVGQNEKEAT